MQERRYHHAPQGGFKILPQVIPGNFDFRCKRNNTLMPIEMAFYDETSNLPIDLTGMTIRMWFRVDAESPIALKITNSDYILVTDAANGKLTISPISNPLIVGINADSYEYDMKLILPTGEEFTYLIGVFIVDENITD